VSRKPLFAIRPSAVRCCRFSSLPAATKFSAISFSHQQNPELPVASRGQSAKCQVLTAVFPRFCLQASRAQDFTDHSPEWNDCFQDFTRCRGRGADAIRCSPESTARSRPFRWKPPHSCGGKGTLFMNRALALAGLKPLMRVGDVSPRINPRASTRNHAVRPRRSPTPPNFAGEKRMANRESEKSRFFVRRGGLRLTD